ncbi:MAG: phosphatase PAP2 family protein [Dermatophilaceae bacterium]
MVCPRGCPRTPRTWVSSHAPGVVTSISEVGVAETGAPASSILDRDPARSVSSGSPGFGPAARLVGAVVSLLLFAWCYVYFVLTPSGRAVDLAGLHAGEADVLETVTRARWVARALGLSALVPATTVLVVLIALRSWRRAAWLTAYCAGLLVSAQATKSLLPRPLLPGEVVTPNSYPSGHVVLAVAFTVVLVSASHPRVRGAAVAVGAMVIGSSVWAVVGLGWHRPSDAAGSVLLGMFWWSVLGAVVSRRPGDRAPT